MTHVPKDRFHFGQTLWLQLLYDYCWVEQEHLPPVVPGNFEIITSGKGTVTPQVPALSVPTYMVLGKSPLLSKLTFLICKNDNVGIKYLLCFIHLKMLSNMTITQYFNIIKNGTQQNLPQKDGIINTNT